MAENKYKINNVVFFVHGINVVKGVIDEYILHHTQKKVIVKYIIRPYGLKEYVTIDADKIYTDIEEAKKYVIDNLVKTYTKENIRKNYKNARRNMELKFKDEIKKFDENFNTAIDSIKKVNEAYYDTLEQEYQKSIKKEKK